jgi:uncharacterized protein
MTSHLPERLDLCSAAEAGRVLAGRITLASLERVLPLVVSQQGELAVSLELGKDRDGIRYLCGSITGVLVLQCQRCLEPMEFPLAITFRLGLVQDQDAANRMVERYEPLIVTEEPACIAELVADEVLLALPIAPVHGDADRCHAVTGEYLVSNRQERENPFAILEQLKRKQ